MRSSSVVGALPEVVGRDSFCASFGGLSAFGLPNSTSASDAAFVVAAVEDRLLAEAGSGGWL